MFWEKVLEQYLARIKDNTVIQNSNTYSEIITPFLDNSNDHIWIYATKENDNIKLSDDGQTINGLIFNGVNISDKKSAIITNILNVFWVKYDEHTGQIYTSGTIDNIWKKKHYLLQAIVAINDMYLLSRNNIFSFFKEEVDLYFKENWIIYTKDIKLTGKSWLDYNIDFVCPKYKDKKETLIKVVNKPKKDNIIISIGTFTDIISNRTDIDTNQLLIYNDDEGKLSEEHKNALAKYSIVSLWRSQKDLIKQYVGLVNS